MRKTTSTELSKASHLHALGDLTNHIVSTQEEPKALHFQKPETSLASVAQALRVTEVQSCCCEENQNVKDIKQSRAMHTRISDADMTQEDASQKLSHTGSQNTNILSCSAHACDVHDNLRISEHSFVPTKVFNEVQDDITLKMRSILIDWLVEVSDEYKLVPDTLHLAVALLDRFLLLEAVPRKNLQLVGISCMFIAAKFEEIYAPEVADLCYMTDNTYSEHNVIDMERRVLDQLSFRINQPTVCTFVRYYASGEEITKREELLSFYICELSLLDASLMRHAPSMIAAATILLSAYIIGNQTWSNALRRKTRYSAADLKSCALQIATFIKIKDDSPCAIFEKYSRSKMGDVVVGLRKFSWKFPEDFFIV